MTVVRRDSPPESAFLGDIGRAYHWDSYEAPLHRVDLAMQQLYIALFGHHPLWARRLLALRDRIVTPFGLRASIGSEADDAERKTSYAIGDKIARFTLFEQNDTEIVTGGNDKHLDFRVSVKKLTEHDAPRVALSTVVMPHNLFGRIYLRTIIPFHRAGVRMLLSNAAKAGRI